MEIKNLSKKIGASFLILFMLTWFYSSIENAFAVTDDVTVTLDVDAGITISDGANVTMTPNIGIVSNGSIGTSEWTVITNGADGYSLSVKASTSPALVSGANSFADYTEAVADTPEAWSVTSGNKEFGFSAYGTDTTAGTWGTSATCGAAGVPDGDMKYVGFATTDQLIATRSTVTPVAGIATTICFAAEQDGIFAPSGTYTATITGTAITL